LAGGHKISQPLTSLIALPGVMLAPDYIIRIIADIAPLCFLKIDAMYDN